MNVNVNVTSPSSLKRETILVQFQVVMVGKSCTSSVHNLHDSLLAFPFSFLFFLKDLQLCIDPKMSWPYPSWSWIAQLAHEQLSLGVGPNGVPMINVVLIRDHVTWVIISGSIRLREHFKKFVRLNSF